ncbi:Zinc-regulated transporter 2 [Diplodia seriata]|uniref:Zinc-regulated transporter 2 n=1 Tax=Diplodia seriata TaxID=420778 RepID=A0A1S8BFT7_9PEZI|nr:Zinc-regulated transporter 2 [Diplodia seriata]
MPPCATPSRNSNPNPPYNTPLHVASLFIILLVSTLSCASPLLALTLSKRLSNTPKRPRKCTTTLLFTARHFGTGVLLATAFVHLLPTAFAALGDPCLGGFWTEKYAAMPGAIVLGAVLGVAGVEMVVVASATAEGDGGGSRRPEEREGEEEVQGGELHLRNLGALKGRSGSVGRRLTDLSGGGREQQQQQQQRGEQVGMRGEESVEEGLESRQGAVKGGVVPLTPEQEHKKALLQCMLLEMGILFHSVFIGMALSVSIGKEFIILLIAIIFHQTFEGLALGSRIAALKWKRKAVQPWMMSLAYGCTTPVGQAIGLGLHTLYSPDSEVGLLVVGIMNAISAGLLIYASLVELMAEDFLSDESWRVLRGKRRVYACLLVFLGAFGMSLVGAWA